MSEQSAKAKCLRADRLLQRARTANSDKTLIMEALTLYQEALAETDAHLADPYLGLAYVAYSAGQKAEALALLHQAQALEPTNLRVQTLLLRMEKATPLAVSGAATTPSLQPIRSLRQQVEAKKELQWNFDVVSFALTDEDDTSDDQDDELEEPLIRF